MNTINLILNLLQKNIPFALLRINDGEIIALEKLSKYTSRNCQIVSDELSNKLKEAISFRKENYFIGQPCPLCFPNHNKIFFKYVEKNYKYLTYAVVLTNRNFKLVRNRLPEILKDKNIIYIGNKNHKIEKLPFKINEFIKTENKNSFENDYNKIKKEIKSFKSNNIILLSTGILSRILTYEIFKNRNDLIVLDIGTLYSDLIENMELRIHQNKLPKCKFCN